MKVEALNCPNCGSGVASDRTQCEYCKSRLKTLACPSCLGLMFEGSKYCGHCGARSVRPAFSDGTNPGKCPRCKTELAHLRVSDTDLGECSRCDGVWVEIGQFENLCAKTEELSAVLGYFANRRPGVVSGAVINYVPCPTCSQLMNRSNFAKASGVIIDVCKRHGVWCDAGELPKIFEFIRNGGMDLARKRERMAIEDERSQLRNERRRAGLQNTDAPFGLEPGGDSRSGIRAFLENLFD
jgi:Zn-finger nucleic acid-binding protein/RNA polymerase subunit RPABC4/transcription elongation factor Spt4